MANDCERRRQELKRQIAEQEDLVRRSIVLGRPNQAAEDRLRALQRELALIETRPLSP
jgi:hypothetical protein